MYYLILASIVRVDSCDIPTHRQQTVVRPMRHSQRQMDVCMYDTAIYITAQHCIMHVHAASPSCETVEPHGCVCRGAISKKDSRNLCAHRSIKLLIYPASLAYVCHRKPLVVWSQASEDGRVACHVCIQHPGQLISAFYEATESIRHQLFNLRSAQSLYNSTLANHAAHQEIRPAHTASQRYACSATATLLLHLAQ